MFIKSLTISTDQKIIREIKFRKGINLIVDETTIGENKETETGNNVGKTTVLQLVDFCLGADPKGLFLDPENKKTVNTLVKDFLVENKVLITLILKENLDDTDSSEIKIERNFLNRKNIVRRINGANFTDDEFELQLLSLIFPKHISDTPTFRQIISHNIRYKDEKINSTLRTLDGYSSDAVYETLHLFMLGVEFNQGYLKQNLLLKLNEENTFKNRLEKNQSKTIYETALALINNDIENINKKKDSLNINENFESDLDELNMIKYKINKTSIELSNLNIRKELIEEATKDLNSNYANIDLQQLQAIYQQATQQINNIQKTFENLVSYHNQMITEKVKFLTKELPGIEDNIKIKAEYLNKLLEEEKKQTAIISKSDSFEELEKLIAELTGKFQKKGEYETIINQLNDVENEMKDLSLQLTEIDKTMFSEDFEQNVKRQINKFNKYFATISDTLYGEQYALTYNIVTNKKGQKLYKFSSFNTNFSSGKKQGEISCFDIAYILFADDEHIPCLNFILNDKKELMHDNQLLKIASIVKKNNIQFVASILKDKLPEELNNEAYFIIKLSQQDKLFRIENN